MVDSCCISQDQPSYQQLWPRVFRRPRTSTTTMTPRIQQCLDCKSTHDAIVTVLMATFAGYTGAATNYQLKINLGNLMKRRGGAEINLRYISSDEMV